MTRTGLMAAAGLLLLATVGGCAAQDAEPTALEQATRLQAEISDAWLAGDVDAQMALVADDVTFDNVATGDHREGAQAYRGMLEDVAAMTDREQTELVRASVSSDGATGFVEYRWVGTAYAPFDLTMLTVSTYRDGRLAGVELFWADGDATAQLLGG